MSKGRPHALLARLMAIGLGVALASVLGARLGWLGPRWKIAVAAGGSAASSLPFQPLLDEKATRQYFSVDTRADIRFDPLAYIVHTPNSSATWAWEEHPDGEFVRQVNNLAFNEDHPTEPEKHGLRILVAGDSHTAGLVNSSESFCNVAERALQQSLARPDVEVLNAGVGYTSPTCYLGMLQKHLALQPDVFVAVLFTGNDFLDETFLAYAAGKRPQPETPSGYIQRAAKMKEGGFTGPFWQGLNQVYRWKTLPEEEEFALQTTLEVYAAMQRLCAEHSIAFLAVLLPTKMDVDEDDREAWLRAVSDLGLQERDLDLNLAAGRRFMEALRERGIACLDPTEEMVQSREVLYWKKDYHLAVSGHALVGARLAEEIARLLVP